MKTRADEYIRVQLDARGNGLTPDDLEGSRISSMKVMRPILRGDPVDVPRFLEYARKNSVEALKERVALQTGKGGSDGGGDAPHIRGLRESVNGVINETP